MKAKQSKQWLVLAAALSLTACDGGSRKDDGGSESKPNQAEILATLYSTPPDVAACQPGMLGQQAKDDVLNTLNEIRALHGLRPVLYDSASDDEVMQTALMMTANQTSEHHPPTTWRCYSDLGAQGARSSNLSGGNGVSRPQPVKDVIIWLHDATNRVADSVGHRRWLLDPFLKQVAYGIVAEPAGGERWNYYSAIKVIYDDAEAKTNGWAQHDGVVAYPWGDYPARYWHEQALLSLSLLVDGANKWDNDGADFSQAHVRVIRRSDGADLAISELRYDNIGYGLSNNVQFKAAGIEPGVVYDVSVQGVIVHGTVRDVSYWFRIVH